MRLKLFLLTLGMLMLGSAAKAQWGNNPTTRLTTTDSVLIGTNPISSILAVHGQTTLRRLGSSTPLLSLTTGQNDWGHFRQYLNGTDNVFTDYSLQPPNNSGNGTFSFFFNTNTTGTKRVNFYRGNGAPTISASIGVDGENTYFNATGGFLGIGHNSPSAALDVLGGFRLRNANNHTFLTVIDQAGNLVFQRDGGRTAMTIHDDQGWVSVGSLSSPSTFRTYGRGIFQELEIRSGADLSEKFLVSPVDKKEAIVPGLLVSIDPSKPGQLIVTSSAYDHKVAGIISGANGINTGLQLGQEGSIADGDQAVALSGRVYVFADASNGPIQAGDLLTSSSLPGHVMKAKKAAKAHGAIVGKAMTELASGTGYVLVLVNLQ